MAHTESDIPQIRDFVVPSTGNGPLVRLDDPNINEGIQKSLKDATEAEVKRGNIPEFDLCYFSFGDDSSATGAVPVARGADETAPDAPLEDSANESAPGAPGKDDRARAIEAPAKKILGHAAHRGDLAHAEAQVEDDVVPASEESETVHYDLQHLIDRFYELDSDRDGWLSAAEVSKKESHPDKNEAAFFRRITESMSEIESMHDDDGFDSKGITLADLEEMQKRVNASSAALDVFSRIDSNHDRYLSLEELKDDDYHLSDSTLQYLVQNFSEIEEVHNGETWDEDSGINPFDLGFASEDPLLDDSETVQRVEAAQYAEQCFEYLDGDYNGYITLDDLNKLDHDATRPELRYLIENFPRFEEIFDDNTFEELGITRNDVATAQRRPYWDEETKTSKDPGGATGLR